MGWSTNNPRNVSIDTRFGSPNIHYVKQFIRKSPPAWFYFLPR